MQVILNVPNSIAYVRLVCFAYGVVLGTHFARLEQSWWWFLASFALDALDGVLARRLNQVS